MAPAIGAIEEMIGNGEPGIIWSLEDPVGGARALIDLLDDPERYGAMAKVARTRFLEAYTAKGVTAKLLDFLLSFGPATRARTEPADKATYRAKMASLQVGA